MGARRSVGVGSGAGATASGAKRRRHTVLTTTRFKPQLSVLVGVRTFHRETNNTGTHRFKG